MVTGKNRKVRVNLNKTVGFKALNNCILHKRCEGKPRNIQTNFIAID